MGIPPFTFRKPEPGQAAESVAALGVVGAEVGLYQGTLSYGYSLPAALTGMLVGGAVLTATVVVIMRRLGVRPTRTGGHEPPQQV